MKTENKTDVEQALERLEKTFHALMSNPQKPEIFGLPVMDFDKIRKALTPRESVNTKQLKIGVAKEYKRLMLSDYSQAEFNAVCFAIDHLHAQNHLTPAEPIDAWRPTHKHKKRGTEYQYIGSALLQTDKPLSDYASLAVYVGKEGDIWARQMNEFSDGRFEPLPPPPQEGEA